MVRAARTGALDYRHISRSSQASLQKEALVLLDIEAELTAEYMYNKAPYVENASELIDKAFVRQVPWVNKQTEAPKSKVEVMIDEYYRITGKKRPE